MSELILAILAGVAVLEAVIEHLREHRDERIADDERQRSHHALMRELRRHA